MTLGDRIVVLRDGRVQRIDTPGGLYARPRNTFVASFIGTPAMNLVPGTLVDGPPRFLAAGGDGLPLDTAWTPALERFRGRPVVLGVRPEGIALAAAGDRLAMRVELVEPLGNELLVYARWREHEMAVRLPPGSAPEVGAVITVAVDPRQCHLFDAATGERIE